MKQITFFLSVVCVAFAACSEKAEDDANIVARFGKTYLYKDYVLQQIPSHATAADSVEFIENYIKAWGMRNALYEMAENNVSYKNNEIEEQVQRFRTELYIDKYEELFTQQKLDTIITIAQLDTYYVTHKAEFILQYDVVKPLFIVLPKQYVTPQLRRSFMTNDIDNLDQLKDVCYKYSTKFYLDEKWVILNQLQQEVPKQISTQELLNPRGLIVDFEDNVYFIKISKHIQAGNPSPREMVYEKIANNILYKRKIELLNTMRTRVFQDAVRKGEFDVFYK
ncbi:MAG: hypothetical protein LBM68_01360 [Bacteroidales bacterium]|jgi:hypothetical protein|nr:hypothetical protein [Bacteroidales bacterium]